MNKKVFGKFTDTGFKPDKDELSYLENLKEENKGKRGWVEFGVIKRKSLNFLGWYWAALLPAHIAHIKFGTIQEELEFNPLLLDELQKTKKITENDKETWHRTFLREFAPDMVFDLKTNQPIKEGSRMSKMNQSEASMYTTLVFNYMLEQGEAIPDAEKYKAERAKAEETIKSIPYPKREKGEIPF